MEHTVIYVHGKGGSAEEAEHYRSLFPDAAVIGFDYRAANPWEAKEEFSAYFAEQRKHCEKLILAANSIGAFFAMSALDETLVDRAFLISPVVDMKKLICDMMLWAGVTEQELFEKKEIATTFGETLSWEYLCYVRKHPISWHIPTRILYGEHDDLTSMETISAFAQRTGAELTVMPEGEHWFHTEEQMRFLDEWIQAGRRACDAAERQGHNMADLLTGIRILCAPLILIFPAFSAQFYLFCLLGGITDAVDGTVARKLGTATAFGAKLDTIADILFMVAVLIKIVRSVVVPFWLLLWIGGIAVIKAANILVGFFKYHRFVAVHSLWNKICGIVVFAAVLFIGGQYAWQAKALVVIAACIIAGIAAVQEFVSIIRGSRME